MLALLDLRNFIEQGTNREQCWRLLCLQGNVSAEITEYSELEGTCKGHLVQLLNEWPIQGSNHSLGIVNTMLTSWANLSDLPTSLISFVSTAIFCVGGSEYQGRMTTDVICYVMENQALKSQTNMMVVVTLFPHNGLQSCKQANSTEFWASVICSHSNRVDSCFSQL